MMQKDGQLSVIISNLNMIFVTTTICPNKYRNTYSFSFSTTEKTLSLEFYTSMGIIRNITSLITKFESDSENNKRLDLQRN